MGGSLFVLDHPVSGINAYLFRELERCGWSVRSVPVGMPWVRLRWGLVRSFRLGRARWKANYHEHLRRYALTPRMFRERTRLCARLVQEQAGGADIVLQMGGLFAPGTAGRPYVTFNDYTTRLARRRWPEWAPFASEAQAQEWFGLEAGLYLGAACVFTASENTRRSIVEEYGAPAERVLAVGEGLNFDAPVDAGEKVYDGRTILFVGKEFERKGGPVLLRAFERVRRRIPAARLVILGPLGPRADAPGVEWAGLVEDRNVVRAHFARSSLFVMPSRCEPFGLVFLEAMAHRLPCIGADLDAMPEIIADGESGLLVQPEDEGDLADKIESLLNDPARLRAMGEAGFRRVQRYTWARVARDISAQLDELVHRR